MLQNVCCTIKDLQIHPEITRLLARAEDVLNPSSHEDVALRVGYKTFRQDGLVDLEERGVLRAEVHYSDERGYKKVAIARLGNDFTPS